MRRMKLFARHIITALPGTMPRHVLFLLNYRRFLNLRRPRTFNEKVNWRIVHDRRPILATMSSKYYSKRFARERVPDISVPRTIWYGSDLNELSDIEISGHWVLKVDHRSGSVLFGSGPPKVADVHRKAGSWLERDELDAGRLWAYSVLDPAYILEERIGGPDYVPTDYKFFVFDGDVRLIQVDRNRFGSPVRNLYSPTWSALPFSYTWNPGPVEQAPPSLDLMLAAASRLGEGLDFVRVDLFNVGGRIYFGELTVYPAGGLSHWPRELDLNMGRYWNLPTLGDDSA